MRRALLLTVLGALLLLAAACAEEAGTDDADAEAEEAAAEADDESDDEAAGDDERPRVAVAFNILADVAEETFGDEVELIDIMPRGVDPHSYEISASEAEPVYDADLLIANGLDHEEGLATVIRTAEQEGVPLLEIAPKVDPLPYDEDVVEGAGEADEDDEPTLDPHFFTDPVRMAEAPELMVDALVDVAGDRVDEEALRASAEAYAGELEDLHDEVEETLEAVPDDRRALVTNHSVFNYFADRYGFEEIGAVVPSGTTLASPSAADLEDLANAIEDAGVPAIFADIGSPDDLANALAEEVDLEVEVVALYTETLGEEGSGSETYVEMQRTNAEEIAEALTD